jgi:CheY-like chemotaxis protein
MARVLVVEDNPTVATLLKYLLEQAGFEVEQAAHGRLALAALEACQPDAVVSDIKMPIMNGLELVEAIRRLYPSLPVILTTGYGSDETATEALQHGAVSYVLKSELEADLVPTLRNVLSVTTGRNHQTLLSGQQLSAESVFELETDVALVTPLVTHLDGLLQRLNFCDDADRIRLGIALHEALVNAIVHGNLEITSESREDGPGAAYARLIDERRGVEPYRGRKVHVRALVSRDEARFVIRDEGPGYDPALLPDPTHPEYIERVSGRGMFLIRTFLDEVHHNERGNEITLVKRRRA